MRDFLRAAAASPEIRVGDPDYNAEQIVKIVREAAGRGVKLLVLPELCLTGYTCGDLFLQEALLSGAERALARLRDRTSDLDLVFAVGMPAVMGDKLCNCAAVLHRGKTLALVPKRWIPDDGPFCELRYFTPYDGENRALDLNGERVPFGNRFLLQNANQPALCFGVEIGADLWVPQNTSAGLCEAGARLILNLSASAETLSKADYRRRLVSLTSAKQLCGYLYADAGAGESTTDLVFSGHCMLCENGSVLAENRPFSRGLLLADFDLGLLEAERRRTSTFHAREGYETILFAQSPDERKPDDPLLRPLPPNPFLPAEEECEERLEEILTIQSMGLKQRMEAARVQKLVVGVSGGLDSCLALLVSVRTCSLSGRNPSDVVGVSMPCFGTTSRTRNNAERLCRALGVSFREIDITKSVSRHLADLGRSPESRDVVYENAQARERTQVLMDLANSCGGLVVGTGDLSELALGWTTYNGDHMSMYGVNAGLPKTLVRRVVGHAATRSEAKLKAVLSDILDTPVSPELLPSEDGNISQRTEELVGPYELHDFFLFHVLCYGSRPEKVFFLARHAFPDTPPETIKKWLQVFYRRFFSQQFKRSCLPDGPKVGSVSLSPRGDFRMPSDASAALWLKEAEGL